jgi:prolyl-tRNA editing enzyme YbaK/EbsC (Cys-tRNA(Pro) deacylase)
MDALHPMPALERPHLLAEPVDHALRSMATDVVGSVEVVEISPDLADTASFCDAYGFEREDSANCVIVAGKRAGEVRYAACIVLATTRVDVNTVVRKRMDVKKASFAAMDDAVALSGMEYGGITPFGLPSSWPVFVDSAVLQRPRIILGSGLRTSKILAPGSVLREVAGVEVVEGLGRPG